MLNIDAGVIQTFLFISLVFEQLFLFATHKLAGMPQGKFKVDELEPFEVE